MTLAELGAKLREAREARGLSVADVADYLKIPSRILEGAEEGSDHLPRTVYVYHFIKDYAKYLGFSASEAGSWLSSVDGFENISRPVIVESAPFTPVKPSILPAVIGALLKLGVAAALVFGAYTAYVQFFAGRDYDDLVKLPAAQEQAVPAVPSSPASPQAAPVWEPVAPEKSGKPAAQAQEAPSADAPKPAPQVEPRVPVSQAPQWDAPAASDTAPAEPAVTQNMSADAGSVSQPAASADGAESAVPADSALSAEETSPAAVSSASAPSSAPSVQDGAAESSAFAALPAGDHHVEVVADAGDCWMGFEADGRKQQRFLRKGDSFTLAFRDALVMKLGDAGAVRVVYNGRELERSVSGRVLTLRFPLP
ncbi:RodZ domain-containing protein [Mailhella sp.]|uniref:RodZ domain-containing protein n=1 Tax=Mailhella sp. TaxID=1981029 RepID=UPI0040635B0D